MASKKISEDESDATEQAAESTPGSKKREVLSLFDAPKKKRRRRNAEEEEAKEPEEPKKSALETAKESALDLIDIGEKLDKPKLKRRPAEGDETVSDTTFLPPISLIKAEEEGTLPAKPGANLEEESTGEEGEGADPTIIHIKPPIVVRDLADRMDLKPHLLLKDLLELNVFVSLNQAIEPDVAEKLCEKHGFTFEREKREKGAGVHKVEEVIEEPEEVVEEVVEDELKPRAPIITFMGHVDHGKTSLLDYIRKSRVAAGEAGGITQHIGAYAVEHNGLPITFIDTPGHAAFSEMRARGANVTDIVVLVVAADDGFMPQTKEALAHAKAAGVTIIVAINKCDLVGANPDRVKQQMQQLDIPPTEWGGETECIQVSAMTGEGMDDLLELLALQAEVLELKADPTANARAIVIESRLEPGKGPTGTVIVESGTLKVGKPFICGPYHGKVKSLLDDRGARIKEAQARHAGRDPRVQRPAACRRRGHRDGKRARREKAQRGTHPGPAQEKLERPQRSSLETLFTQFEEGRSRRSKSFSRPTRKAPPGDRRRAQRDRIQQGRRLVPHLRVSAISESDVLLASASNAIILGFNTKLENKAVAVVKREGVQVKLFSIIYELIDQVREAMLGLLEAETREKLLVRAE
ncbi:MAG: translation initiation factor IF-2 [Verrucomicrobiales bacterium]